MPEGSPRRRQERSTSAWGHSRPGRASSKSGHVRSALKAKQDRGLTLRAVSKVERAPCGVLDF